MRKPKKLPTILNQEEFSRLLKYTTKKHHRLAFKLGFLCGFRVSEVVKLKPVDIDRGRGMIHIKQSKGKKDRYVPIPKPIVKDLSNIPKEWCSARALQISFNKKVIRAKILKQVSFHTLRHSCASYYLKKGMSLKEVQQLLGHSRMETTAIYLHTSPEDVKQRMDEIWK